LHNKTLAAQLYSEFKEFFPENAVEYFVSYYDYYQPEAYVPQTDTYIEKGRTSTKETNCAMPLLAPSLSGGMLLSLPRSPVSTVWGRLMNIAVSF